MSYQVPPENWKKKVKRRHSLSYPHLRRIRYALRTVLYLMYKEEQRKIINKRSRINRDDSLSYEERRAKSQKLSLKLSELNAMTHYYPISCAVCSSKMKDLTFRPRRGGYLCDAANDMWKNASPLECECDREDGGEQPERCILCGHTYENMVYSEKKGYWYCSNCWEQIKHY